MSGGALAGLGDEERALVRPAAPPTTARAMKAVLTDERFSNPGWIFERKLDGIRCIAIRSGADVRLLSRNDLSLNGRYPEIAAALAAERADRFAILRGNLTLVSRNQSYPKENHYAAKSKTD